MSDALPREPDPTGLEPDGVERAGSLATKSSRGARVVRTVALVTGSVLALGGGLALAGMILPTVFELALPHNDPRVLGAQTSIIDDVLESTSELDEQLEAANVDFESQVSTWQAFESGADQWRASIAAAPAGVANPGGDVMPGDDPTGRTLLDLIGATNVTIAFDAGGNNCGYSSIESDPPYSLAIGGCYNSAYRNTLFMAWDPGTEDSVWPIFVHEAMHWYQADRHYELYFAIENAGADQAAWSNLLEVDASCRAVFQFGIPIEDLEDTSAPCTALDWTDDWLVRQAAALGAMVAAPDPESFEVLEVVRP